MERIPPRYASNGGKYLNGSDELLWVRHHPLRLKRHGVISVYQSRPPSLNRAEKPTSIHRLPWLGFACDMNAYLRTLIDKEYTATASQANLRYFHARLEYIRGIVCYANEVVCVKKKGSVDLLTSTISCSVCTIFLFLSGFGILYEPGTLERGIRAIVGFLHGMN